MKPKISIITVCYNSKEHIEEAIQSVINQTYDNVEYIIVDGGSTDGTIDIIKRYEDKISVIISEPDNGISDAFNKGINVSSGDIIGIVNSDDKFYSDDVLEKVASYYSPEIDIYRGSEIIRNYETDYEYVVNPTMKLQKNPVAFHVCHMAMFLSKDAVKKYGLYDVGFKYSMDKELLCRYLYHGAKSIKMEVIVGLFRLGGVSQSNNIKKIQESIQIVKLTGGTNFQVLTYGFSLCAKELLKRILNIFDADLARRIRYKRNSRKK